jgi:hypothetical protein
MGFTVYAHAEKGGGMMQMDSKIEKMETMVVEMHS